MADAQITQSPPNLHSSVTVEGEGEGRGYREHVPFCEFSVPDRELAWSPCSRKSCRKSSPASDYLVSPVVVMNRIF